MNFDDAFDRLIGHEGGYTNDPRDKGNWTGGAIHSGELRGTKFGISAAAYPHVDIEALSLAGAKNIYKHDYWDKIISDDIPEAIRFALFDMAVNSGVGFAIKILQRALGVKDDGKLGQQTLTALRSVPSNNLANLLNAQRLIAMTNMSGWSDYGKGWARRIATNIIEDNTL